MQAIFQEGTDLWAGYYNESEGTKETWTYRNETRFFLLEKK